MEFEQKNNVSHPKQIVYFAMKDKLEELAQFILTLHKIELKSREKISENHEKIIRKWYGKYEVVPSAVRRFIKESMLTWEDHALWEDENFLVRWESHSGMLKHLYSCSGINYFEDGEDNISIIRITGKIEVYPEKLPGVPKFLARRFTPIIEKFIIGLISPNFAEIIKGINKYLDSKNSQ